MLMAKVVESSYRARLSSVEIKSLETKTLNRCIEILTEQLDIDQVLDKLLEKELISGEQHGVIRKLVEDRKRKQAVRIAIEQLQLNPPGFLETFCSVLKGDKRTEWLVEEITKGNICAFSPCSNIRPKSVTILVDPCCVTDPIPI